MIMTGKYGVLRDQVRLDKVGLKQCDRYLNGLDVKKITLSAQETYVQHPYQTTRLEEEGLRLFHEECDRWFEMDEVRAKESWIIDLLIKSKEDLHNDGDKNLTFLT
jgi:hypothetical protein